MRYDGDVSCDGAHCELYGCACVAESEEAGYVQVEDYLVKELEGEEGEGAQRVGGG